MDDMIAIRINDYMMNVNDDDDDDDDKYNDANIDKGDDCYDVNKDHDFRFPCIINLIK